ncbi:hypothetical protein JHK85_006592 [Glycine max]|nr:hypothetical protein JHK85_006592 [Glycine max]KAG5071197.1 hypothetical protein JHK86_006408 [Glycine max]
MEAHAMITFGQEFGELVYKCLDDTVKSLLLQLKNNFTFSESGIKLNSWNASDLQHQLCHSIWIQQVEGFSIPEFV